MEVIPPAIITLISHSVCALHKLLAAKTLTVLQVFVEQSYKYPPVSEVVPLSFIHPPAKIAKSPATAAGNAIPLACDRFMGVDHSPVCIL